MSPRALVLRSQGWLYLTTGLWPVVHLRSFEAVTGKKREGWLVRTMGAVLASVGAALLVEARGGEGGHGSPAVPLLGASTAAVLAASDVRYASTGRIRRIYLLDAVAEAAIVAGWAWALVSPRGRPRAPAPRGG